MYKLQQMIYRFFKILKLFKFQLQNFEVNFELFD